MGRTGLSMRRIENIEKIYWNILEWKRGPGPPSTNGEKDPKKEEGDEVDLEKDESTISGISC